jgi:hypothetical protein
MRKITARGLRNHAITNGRVAVVGENIQGMGRLELSPTSFRVHTGPKSFDIKTGDTITIYYNYTQDPSASCSRVESFVVNLRGFNASKVCKKKFEKSFGKLD